MSLAPRILVSGFGPFPGVPENPAGRIVRLLRDRAWRPDGADLDWALLPTTWDGAVATLSEAIEAARPDAVLAVGVATGAEGFRVETLAHNRIAAERTDAAGAVHPAGPIDANGPPFVSSTAPTAAMVGAIGDAGLAAALSNDAGDYLCNFVFYRLLTEIAAGRPAGFLHIPPSGHGVSGLPLEALALGVRAAVAAFAADLSRPRPAAA